MEIGLGKGSLLEWASLLRFISLSIKDLSCFLFAVCFVFNDKKNERYTKMLIPMTYITKINSIQDGPFQRSSRKFIKDILQ